MNSKQFGKLLVLLLVIGGVGLFLNTSRQKDWKEASGGGGGKVLGQFDVNSVAGLTIKDSTNELNVVKQGESWVVKERGNYPAKFSTLAEFIRKVADLKVVQQEQIGESQYARMEVNPPGAEKGAGVLVEFKDKDGKALKSLILGKKQMKEADPNSPFGGGDFPVGRWILNLADKGSLSLASETFSDAEPRPKDWLDKGFVEVQKLKSIEVVAPDKTNSWTVTRDAEGGTWQLAGVVKGEQVDTNKVSAIGNPLGSPSFQDVITDAKPETTGFATGAVVRLATFDGFNYALKIGAKTEAEDYHFNIVTTAALPAARTPGKDEKPEDKEKLDKEFAEQQKKLKEKLAKEEAFNQWTYLVSKWTVDAFLKKRSELMVEKKEEEKKPETISIPETPTPLLTPPNPVPPAPPKPAVPPAPKAATKNEPAAPKPAVQPVQPKKDETPKAPAKPAVKTEKKEAPAKPAAPVAPKTTESKPVEKAKSEAPAPKPAAPSDKK